MRTALSVLTAALIALPVLAAPKPTPTPAANRKKVLDGKTSRMPVPLTVTPMPAAARKSQTIYQEGRGGAPAAVTPTAGPVEGKPQKQQQEGRWVVVSGERVWVTPTAGAERLGTAGPVDTTPAADERKYQTISNTSRGSGKTTPSPTVGPLDSINLNSSRSNRVVQPAAPPNPRLQPAGRMPTMTGRVLSQQGRMFTVLVNGKAITFSGAKLQALPEVGDTVDIDATRTPDGQLEATRTSRVKLKGTSR